MRSPAHTFLVRTSAVRFPRVTKPENRRLPTGIYLRGNIYWISYTRHGRQHVESTRRLGHTGRDLNEAKRLLNERRGEIAKGVPITADASRFTFNDAIQLIVDNYTRNDRRSIDHLNRRLDKHLTPHFGGMRLGEISADVVDAFVAKRKKANAANGEINRELAVLKRMFTLAMQARKAHSRPHIEMLKEAPPRAGFFEYGDFQRVLPQLPPEVQPLAQFCYITGWRWRSEVRELTWTQVDLRRGTVSIDAGKTKAGEARVFHVTPELKKLLKKQRAYTDRVEAETDKPCALVFHRGGQPIEWFYTSWRNACDTAKVPGRLLHDLRRTAIRNLVRAGVSETVAMKMCGHKTRSIFDRYNVSSENDLKAASVLLGAHHRALARQARASKGERQNHSG